MIQSVLPLGSSSKSEELKHVTPAPILDTAGFAAAIPMGRMGKIEELGELAAFLACEESSYITGQGIVIDGGSTLPETATMGV